MNNKRSAFDSAIISQNIMWSKPQHSLDQEEYLISSSKYEKKYDQNKENNVVKEIKDNSKEEIFDLQDVWNSIQEKTQPQNTHKVQILNIVSEPETLTSSQFQEVFGITTPVKEPENFNLPQVQQIEDLGDLWEQVNETSSIKEEKVQKSPKSPIFQPKSKQDEPELQKNPKAPKQPQFFQIEEKDESNKTCLTLGKNFEIFNPFSFLVNCYSTNTYSYFGFEENIKNKYNFFDLTTNKSIITCSLEPYEQIGQNVIGRKTISFEKDYCLKMRIASSGELIATMWKKTTSNGTLFNLRIYNAYEQKYEESLALIQVADGYIGNFCYCNTVAHLSQKYSKISGPFKMKLSLKNGFLIAHMGVNGIKSAPYNCRLQSTFDSFVYLLGMIEKQKETFIVRVGQGMSPLVAFAISIGRKRYIDSFKE